MEHSITEDNVLSQKLKENPVTGLQWFKKRVENNISWNEANVFFDWYSKNEKFIANSDEIYEQNLQPWLILKKLLEKKIAYLEKNLDKFSSEKALDWLNHNQSFIQLGEFSEKAKKIRSLIFFKKLEHIDYDWFEKRFSKSIDEINIFFDLYKKNMPEMTKIVQLGKQKMLEQIRKETKQETNELIQTHAWLKELLPEEKEEQNIVGKGKSGIVVTSEQMNMVIKILDLSEELSLKKQLEQLQVEIQTHDKFWEAIYLGKKLINHPIPQWLHASEIIKIANPMAPHIHNRTYLMERIKGVTLKRWVYLKLEKYRTTLAPFTEQEIKKLSEIEFDKLLEKRNSKIKPDGTFPKKGELFPSIFSEVFPEKSKELQQALEYLRESQNLIHPDLQWKNILIDDKEQIYLIDFAP
jgi:hypothetical protein